MTMNKDASLSGNRASFFLILLGLLITAADLVTLFEGVELCSFEGCRLAQDSPYAHIGGAPLAAFGLAYFIVSAILALKNKRWLFYWSAVGVGTSLYFLCLQKFVLGEFCLICVVVEIVIFSLFILSAARGVSLFMTVLLIAVAFLGLHFLYTWGTLERDPGFGAKEDTILTEYYTTEGKGGKALFFFDLDCPACVEALPKVREWSDAEGIKVVFREVIIHSPEDKAFYLYHLLSRGMDPWNAIRKVEGAGDVPEPLGIRGKEEKLLRRLLASNRRLLKELGFEGVPALLLQRRGEVVGSEGLEAVTNMLSSCDLQSREDRTVLEDSREGLGAVCVPQRCQ